MDFNFKFIKYFISPGKYLTDVTYKNNKINKCNKPENHTKSLINNTRWMLISEVIAKISRVLTILVMAAYLSPENYGLAALVLLWHELFRVFTRAGAGAKVIQCQIYELAETSTAALVQQWIFCGIVIIAQWFLSPYLAAYYNRPELTPLLQWSAFAHALFPLVSVRVFLIQRANRMKAFGLAQACSVSSENIAIMLFLIAGFGISSVVYAKIISAIVWCICFKKIDVATGEYCFTLKRFNSLWGFSLKVFGSDLVKLLRFHLDTLLAASLLSADALGIYSFAKNAGVGLSQSLSQSYLSSVLPYFSELNRQKKLSEGLLSALRITIFMGVLFCLQALFAPLYIELLFSAKWQLASSLVSLLCLAAIPALFLDVSCLAYRANNQVSSELIAQFIATLSAAAIILNMQPRTPSELANGYLYASVVWLLISTLISTIFIKINPINTTVILGKHHE